MLIKFHGEKRTWLMEYTALNFAVLHGDQPTVRQLTVQKYRAGKIRSAPEPPPTNATVADLALLSICVLSDTTAGSSLAQRIHCRKYSSRL